MIPVPLALGYGTTELSLTKSLFLILIYVIGLIMMLGSDYQKFTTLNQKKGT